MEMIAVFGVMSWSAQSDERPHSPDPDSTFGCFFSFALFCLNYVGKFHFESISGDKSRSAAKRRGTESPTVRQSFPFRPSVSRLSVEIVLQFVVRVILDFLVLLTGKISGNPCCFFSSSYFCHFCHGSSVWFSVSPAFHWRLMMSHWGPVEEAHPLPRPHLPPRYVCISISLPRPPSLLPACDGPH